MALMWRQCDHYIDVIMSTIASQITSLTSVYSIVYSDADQRKHQSSVWLAFVLGIHRGPVNSPHKWPVTRKVFPLDDVIMPHPIMNQFVKEFAHVCTFLLDGVLWDICLMHCGIFEMGLLCDYRYTNLFSDTKHIRYLQVIKHIHHTYYWSREV